MFQYGAHQFAAGGLIVGDEDSLHRLAARRSSSRGMVKLKRLPLPGFARQPDAPAMLFHQLLRDRQAEPGALLRPRTVAPDLIEFVEDGALLELGNSDAGVADRNLRRPCRVMNPSTRIRPPSGVNFTALLSRLKSTLLEAHPVRAQRDVRHETALRGAATWPRPAGGWSPSPLRWPPSWRKLPDAARAARLRSC